MAALCDRCAGLFGLVYNLGTIAYLSRSQSYSDDSLLRLGNEGE